MKAYRSAAEWLKTTRKDPRAVESGARRFALTLGRATELARLVRHANWALGHGDRRPRAAALRFAQTAIDQIAWPDADDAYLLANGTTKE